MTPKERTQAILAGKWSQQELAARLVLSDTFTQAIHDAVEAETERCAVLVEELPWLQPHLPPPIARAIRVRNDQ